ncbi:DUF6773 family protein [Aminipila luticellarii]|uniref:Uncharacterized protein n=1 Tax=Aminipila luticellarii TaxID=2507160 RepID=A0A410PS78_9FIRM|nr:DUF6773 family protein [Aminipila luticellarii]QAT41847.1 hypothetical protein EQM06_00640 [Aminipila luticellarii]
MSMKSKKILDERQELQSLKNTRICWTIAIFLLAFSAILQMVMLDAPMYYMPELVILFAVCILNLILNAVQGNLYTKEMQNYTFNMFLYIMSALTMSLIIGVGNYIKYDLPPIAVLFITIPLFLFTFALMLLCDYIYRKVTLRRLRKFDKKLEKEEKKGALL